MRRDDYVLRPLDLNEVSRLEFQNEVWRKQTAQVVDTAGFGPGDRLLDLGSGPGFLSYDLAERVGPSGSVTAVDSSEHFVAYVKAQSRQRGLAQLHAEVSDARAIDLPAHSVDGAICRWVLMFVSEPEKAAANVFRALRPGGAFAVMEYTQFRSTSLWPEGSAFRKIYEKVHSMIAGVGGDADIGGRVPALLVDAGFEIEALLPIWRVGGPDSPEWAWLEGTHSNHQNLVEAGLVSEDELEAYFREWEAAAMNPAAVFTAPPLLATIARKP